MRHTRHCTLLTEWLARLSSGTAIVAAAMCAACAARTPPPAVGVSGVPLAATTDSAVLAHGSYLVNGPGHCAACHSSRGPLTPMDHKRPPDLVGGYAFRVPGGRVRTPNITPDPETGIGHWTDADLVGALRYGIRPDGRRLMPFMELQALSDFDLVAVISYLRSRAPVYNQVRVRDMNWAARQLAGMFVKAPGPAAPPLQQSPTGPSVARGEYLSHHVAACLACHTRRSRTGGYKGEPFAGGQHMPDELERTRELVTPNLTPDPETGHMVKWTEDEFVARFRKGREISGSPMPWEHFARMTDADLRSIYRYLNSLRPVRHETGALMRQKH